MNEKGEITMLNKLKARKNQLQGKGGFTLVELIVVLVILAILAALLIPALTGYIDRAKEKSAVAECRQVVMAAQTLYDEAYADRKANLGFGDGKAISYADVLKLADVTGSVTEIIVDDTGTNPTRKINSVKYSTAGGYAVTFNGTEYSKG